MSGMTNKTNYQTQGFAETLELANIAVAESRESTPLVIRNEFRPYIRYVASFQHYEYGWILR